MALRSAPCSMPSWPTKVWTHEEFHNWRIANVVYPVDTVTMEMNVLPGRTSIEFAARIPVEPQEKSRKRRR
ncbi:MAG: hypothetical protein QOK02_1372 [Mycobacterium sp.]|nr:hypothetical protein [Mycobacterium sp.]